MTDAKHPRHEEVLSGVKASQARLLNEAEPRKKELSQGTSTTKNMKTLPDDASASSLEAVSLNTLMTTLHKVQQELATKEVEQWET